MLNELHIILEDVKLQMDFYLDTGDVLGISDAEISELLSRVFVDGGFTDPETAIYLFEPSAVRRRGKTICARAKQDLILAGMVIVAYPDSPAHLLAQGNETEMHLLGVKPEYRGNDLGKRLVAAAINNARQEGCSKMLLWTQPTMRVAQRLYGSSGFVRRPGPGF